MKYQVSFGAKTWYLHSHVKISPLLWLDNKQHLSDQKTIKYFSTLEQKFRISARPFNILYLFCKCLLWTCYLSCLRLCVHNTG